MAGAGRPTEQHNIDIARRILTTFIDHERTRYNQAQADGVQFEPWTVLKWKKELPISIAAACGLQKKSQDMTNAFNRHVGSHWYHNDPALLQFLRDNPQPGTNNTAAAAPNLFSSSATHNDIEETAMDMDAMAMDDAPPQGQRTIFQFGSPSGKGFSHGTSTPSGNTRRIIKARSPSTGGRRNHNHNSPPRPSVASPQGQVQQQATSKKNPLPPPPPRDNNKKLRTSSHSKPPTYPSTTTPRSGATAGSYSTAASGTGASPGFGVTSGSATKSPMYSGGSGGGGGGISSPSMNATAAEAGGIGGNATSPAASSRGVAGGSPGASSSNFSPFRSGAAGGTPVFAFTQQGGNDCASSIGSANSHSLRSTTAADAPDLYADATKMINDSHPTALANSLLTGGAEEWWEILNAEGFSAIMANNNRVNDESKEASILTLEESIRRQQEWHEGNRQFSLTSRAQLQVEKDLIGPEKESAIQAAEATKTSEFNQADAEFTRGLDALEEARRTRKNDASRAFEEAKQNITNMAEENSLDLERRIQGLSTLIEKEVRTENRVCSKPKAHLKVLRQFLKASREKLQAIGHKNTDQEIYTKKLFEADETFATALTLQTLFIQEKYQDVVDYIVQKKNEQM